jgi:Ca-activated chloride channel family protein
VVAFDLSADQAREIECIATQTGGQFLAADDAGGLLDALNVAITVVAYGPPQQI